MENTEHFTLILFGGTGDLAARKLVPALYNLYVEGKIKDFSLIGISRKEISDAQYREYFYEWVRKFSRNPFDDAIYEKMSSGFRYVSGDLNQQSTYDSISEKLKELGSTSGNRLFFLATAPEFFPVVVEHLSKNSILLKEPELYWHRVMIEKPFGSDLQSASVLNHRLTQFVNDHQMFRIDHYLGKEAVQNIITLRFSNGIFEPLWNSSHIDNIQITAAETLGVGSRGRYYEFAGAIRDMLQNHIIQLLALIGMEPPSELTPEAIAYEKIKVISNLRISEHGAIVLGQYKGYNTEKDVDPNSRTETFVAAKLEIKNWRWSGVPVYVRTGKNLKDKKTNIIIQFKGIPHNVFKGQEVASNKLEISIEPKTGINLQFNVKEPQGVVRVKAVKMNYCHECEFGSNTPESYEKLLYDAVAGDASLFATWDEIEKSWRLTEQILKIKRTQGPTLYEKGSWGPDLSGYLLQKDNRVWDN